MALAPKESIELYYTMMEVALRTKMPQDAIDSLRKLDPDSRFKASYIGKREAGAYERALKAELDGWLGRGWRSTLETMLASLSASLARKIKDMELVSTEYPYGVEFLKANFLPALVELNAKNQLPAVVFCLNRQLCVDLALHVLYTLEAMEEKTHAEEGGGSNKVRALIIIVIVIISIATIVILTIITTLHRTRKRRTQRPKPRSASATRRRTPRRLWRRPRPAAMRPRQARRRPRTSTRSTRASPSSRRAST
jgi:hypothetical protein